MKHLSEMKTQQKIGLGLALAVLLATLVIPIPNGLTIEGRNTIGLMLFFLIMLITEALPISVSSLLTIGLMPLFGASENFAGAVVGFAHPVVFFIIASFGIAGAVMNVPLTKRILLVLLRRAGGRVERILLALMVATAVVSFFMSNVPTCAIMMTIALEFVNLLDEEEEKRRIGKTFMIAIPVATMIGGMATPASSSLNLLAIGLLEQHAGTTITFVQWMAIGIPLVVVLLPFAWFLMLKVYKPSPIAMEKIEQYVNSLHVPKKMHRKELTVLLVLAAMLVLWIASSWLRSIEVFTVALLGCVLFFLPGIRVLSWDQFVKSINWHIIFLSGAVLSTASALVNNGVSSWLVATLYPANLAPGAALLVALAAALTFLMLLIVTSAPALITVLAGPFVAIAAANGVAPAYLILALALCACNCYLLPLDTVQLLTYSKGYYRMTDMGKSTVFLQLALIALLALWVPFMGGVLGLG